jgi:Helix-turn-helix domain
VAKKFSLKDNPIFQRLEAPGSKDANALGEEAPPPLEVSPSSGGRASSSEDQNLTLNHSASEVVPQELTPTQPSPPQTTHMAIDPPLQGPAITPTTQDLPLKEHLDKSLFFGFFNEMVDELLPMLDPTEQVLYIRLFRLSYGFNRNYCTVSQSLLIERTGFSRNTVRTSLQSLVRKGWIGIVGAGNRVSTTYRVVLPREQVTGQLKSGVNHDPQNLTLTNRPSRNDGHEMSRKLRGSGMDPPEAQNLDLQPLTLSNRPPEDTEKINTYARGSTSEGQELPPLLKAFTSNSLTLQSRERGSTSEGQTLTLTALTLSARELVDKFYSHLGQRPSRAKRDKSVEECLALFLEGFAVDEVDYAITWLVRHHPGTGSFSRLVHFIDQAIKEREAEQHAQEFEQQQRHEAEHQRTERQRLEEERQQIEEVKALLPQGTLEELYQEAAHLVEQESPNLKFGKGLIIRIKLNELVKLRYLS